jgi:hypothetical protein
MKNIHILPTDKPSRLHEYDFLSPMGLSKEPLQWRLGRNIYITSDEEIKTENWYKSGKFIWKMKYSQWGKEGQGDAKKIILTTDQELIADGIQAIDDEFLEWFVKNPSCESVEVNEGIRYEDEWIDNEDGGEIFRHQYGCYKIIIPQEGPKLIKCYCGHTTTCDCGPQEVIEKTFTSNEENPVNITVKVLRAFDSVSNQETLEEAAKEYRLGKKGFVTKDDCKKGFIAGAKWQQERSYSEEEVLDILQEYSLYKIEIELEKLADEIPNILTYNEWFEQFKKK